MLSTQSLRDQMDRYAGGDVSVETLEEWLAAESWDMRRWAPVGLQHLVEAIQVGFINYSDRKISEDELKKLLLSRRDQLHRAREVTKTLESSRVLRADIIRHERGDGMKDYPVDRFLNVVIWPMDMATRVRSQFLKLFFVLLYPLWFFALLPIFAPVLFVSIAWMVWDDVNER